MGYFVSVLRERIANFEAPPRADRVPEGAQSRRHRRHRHLHQRPPQKPPRHQRPHGQGMCSPPPRATASSSTPRSSPALTRRRRSNPRWPPSTPPTTRSPPTSASRRPRADQKIVQSKRAVEIETLKAQAEVEPLVALADQLTDLKANSAGALDAYVRNVRLKLLQRSQDRHPGGQP